MRAGRLRARKRPRAGHEAVSDIEKSIGKLIHTLPHTQLPDNHVELYGLSIDSRGFAARKSNVRANF